MNFPRLMLTMMTLGIVTAMSGNVMAQRTPIGPSSWLKADGKIQRAMSPRGISPVMNYQKDDGSWDVIVDDWVQVGSKQVWKSVRGKHRVFADSTGAAIYAKGNHYLGTETTHLIKFKKSDSTWTTLETVAPDSVTTAGRAITFWGIAPGINKRLINNAKIFQYYAEEFEFTQAGRDWLATKGPWGNRLFGTATKLSVDSLNLTLRDALGVFGIDSVGRIVDGYISLGSADTTAFYLTESHLRTEDSTTSIRVRKFIAKRNGNFWLVELFDPIAASALPAGTIRHNAVFGNETPEGATGSLQDEIHSDIYTMGPTSGTMDSITAWLSDGGGAGGNKKRYAIYETDGTLLGTTVEQTPGVNGSDWHDIEASGTVVLVADTDYQIAAWCNFVSQIKVAFKFGKNTQKQDITYSGTYPDPEAFVSYGDTENLSIYVTYTEDAGGSGVQQKQWFWGDRNDEEIRIPDAGRGDVLHTRTSGVWPVLHR